MERPTILLAIFLNSIIAGTWPLTPLASLRTQQPGMTGNVVIAPMSSSTTSPPPSSFVKISATQIKSIQLEALDTLSSGLTRRTGLASPTALQITIRVHQCLAFQTNTVPVSPSSFRLFLMVHCLGRNSPPAPTELERHRPLPHLVCVDAELWRS